MSLQKNGQDLKQINNAKNDLLKKKLAVRSIRFVKSSQILYKITFHLGGDSSDQKAFDGS